MSKKYTLEDAKNLDIKQEELKWFLKVDGGKESYTIESYTNMKWDKWFFVRSVNAKTWSGLRMWKSADTYKGALKIIENTEGKITQAPSLQDTIDNMYWKKSSLPLSQKSEVKYSKPDTPWFNREKPYWLTTEEWDLISKYTNWGYKWKDGIKELDKAIEKIPNSPWITFRWDNLNDFSKFEKWKIVSFDKPLSSSYKSDIADNFKWNTVFTIDGITGKDIDMLSDVSGEWEVLFSSKSKFKVKSVYKSKDWITNIELSQIE